MNTETLRRVQTTQLEIAMEIKRLCEQHNLQYFLIGGTLLGAVRHKGFIPWDDDLDIGMPRKDYDRFIQLCSTELSPEYYLHCHETDPDYWLPFAKVRKNGTELNERAIVPITTHKGIFVDIFPLDNVPDPSSRLVALQSKAVRLLTAVIIQKRGLEVVFGSMWKKTLARILAAVASPLSICALAKVQRSVMTLHLNRTTAYWVSFGSHICHIKETMPKDRYLPCVKLVFEGVVFRVPRDYHYVLTRLYGDYMVLPPIEQQVGHHAVSVRFHNTLSEEEQIPNASLE